MSNNDLVEAMQLLVLDGPALILVDVNQIDLETLAQISIPDLQHPVILLPVEGKPDALKLTVPQLEDALKELKKR